MKLLLASLMLTILAGCVIHDYGHYPRHRGDGWYSQGDDNDQGDRRHRHHRRGDGNSQR